MHTSKAASYMLAASAAVAVLAGCSGGSPQLSPNPLGPGSAIRSERKQTVLNRPLDRIAALKGIASGRRVTTPSFFNPIAKRKPLIFVADQINNVVNIYLQRGNSHMVGQITGLNTPFTLTTDASRNLYVGELFNGDVRVYAPPYTGTPKLVLDNANYGSSDISVSSQGVVAVANLCSLTASGQCNPNTGNVNFYAKNSSKVCASIDSPTKFPYVGFDAFAHDGSLYLTGQRAKPGQTFSGVAEIKGGCNAKRITPLTKTGSLSYGPIRITKDNQIAIITYAYSSNPSVIYTYNLPKHGVLRNPVASATLVDSQAYYFAFLASGSDLYVAESVNSVSSADEYDYPSGGMAEKTIPVSGIVSAVAVTPPLVP